MAKNNKSKTKKKNSNKKKLNKKRFFTFLAILFLIILAIYYVFNVKITNIYIKGNRILTDQEIIDIASIQDYPSSISNMSYKIEKRLESNMYIYSAKVSKKGALKRVYIEVEENYPLFYYLPENKTVLYNEDRVDSNYKAPTLINVVPNTIYSKFISKLKKIDVDILSRISEIEYKPNDVDQERFLLVMNDGNYVYLNLSKFLNLNKYIDMMKSFPNKNGILYLDSGEYFDVFE